MTYDQSFHKGLGLTLTSQSQIAELNKESDFGIYQIYGAHPVYGSNVLIYIGLAVEQTFAVRVSQHGWCHTTSDANQLSYYVGRLFGDPHPDNATWSDHIKLAERLLIHAHKPAENTQKQLAGLEKNLRLVHVVNWRHYRDLMPEVSGARWTERFEELSYDTRYSTVRLAAITKEMATIQTLVPATISHHERP